ncbi:MAG TPA: hypothetical protein VK463_17010 [Desulfomonilaceae bacterium]|nr:hypothetical protein [Desulfomonilaceae bacterium]
MDFEIREAIMGHSRGIAGRYGRFSDQDLVRAIEGMTFDNGDTEIWIARPKKEIPEGDASGEISEQILNNGHNAQALGTGVIL